MKRCSGLKIVRRSNWQNLFDLALPVLDHVFGAQTDRDNPPAWTLGGGTAIAIQIKHRISYDVDLFVAGTRLKLFTPALNPAARAISGQVQWPGHYLKFERPEGEIDFLSAPLQTEPGYLWRSYKGRQIAVETLAEVIVKKIRYRGPSLTARDAYDIAAVAEAKPDLSGVLAAEVPDVLAATRDALELHSRRGVEALKAAVMIGPDKLDLLERAFDVARQTLVSAQTLADQQQWAQHAPTRRSGGRDIGD